jgi:hypothetical protein
METFRKQAHLFIVENWDYYRPFVTLSFNETIGVGTMARKANIKTYDEMTKFLLSKDSLYCYSNSLLDLSNLANMYDMRIAIFTYSSAGSVVPHWTWVNLAGLVGDWLVNLRVVGNCDIKDNSAQLN